MPKPHVQSTNLVSTHSDNSDSTCLTHYHACLTPSRFSTAKPAHRGNRNVLWMITQKCDHVPHLISAKYIFPGDPVTHGSSVNSHGFKAQEVSTEKATGPGNSQGFMEIEGKRNHYSKLLSCNNNFCKSCSLRVLIKQFLIHVMHCTVFLSGTFSINVTGTNAFQKSNWSQEEYCESNFWFESRGEIAVRLKSSYHKTSWPSIHYAIILSAHYSHATVAPLKTLPQTEAVPLLNLLQLLAQLFADLCKTSLCAEL